MGKMKEEKLDEQQAAEQPKMKVLKISDWFLNGERLYGKDKKQWKFKCPSCGGIQTYQEFLDNKIDEANNKFYFSCIGRWIENRGCKWTLGGLLRIHTTEVINEDGDNVAVFEFAN